MLDNSTLFVNVLAFFEAFLRTSVLHTLLIVTHIFILNNLFIFNTSWNSPVALMSVGHVEFHALHGLSSSRFHRESTLRFVPKRSEVPRVLIHLLPRILLRHGLWLYRWSMATTIMSASVSFANLFFGPDRFSPRGMFSVSNVFIL